MKPIVVVLDKLVQRTIDRPIDTVHEQDFATKFATLIKDSIRIFKNPPSAFNPTSGYTPLRDMHKQLVKETKHSNLFSLRRTTKLEALRKSSISMPGLYGTNGQVITIESFEDEVVVLPTKTKPKKLSVIGACFYFFRNSLSSVPCLETLCHRCRV